MTISFDGQVAIVTGAGNGLGRSHALELGRRGAKVVVNDFGGARDGSGGSLSPAEAVVEKYHQSFEKKEQQEIVNILKLQ